MSDSNFAVSLGIGVLAFVLALAGCVLPASEGAGMIQHGNEWHTPDFAYLVHWHNDTYALLVHWHNETYAPLIHWHNSTYALIDHDHAGVYAPLSHTHTESEITDLEHDATKIMTIPIDDTDKADGKVLEYNATSGNFEFETVESEGESHREWNWFDEQGMIGTLRLPLGKPTKYGSNPVLSIGDGEEWDAVRVTNPSALKVNDTYYVFYTGYDGSIYGIGVAYGNSPTSLTKSENNPIFLGTGTPANWNCNIFSPSVIYNDIDNIWEMWFVGESTSPTARVLAYANTTTPLGDWTLDTANPVWSDDSNFNGGSTVLRFGNMYYIAYITGLGTFGSGLSSFPDTGWFSTDQILSLGGSGDFDEVAVGYPSVFWNLGVWYLFYTGLSGSSVYACGMAQSSIGWETGEFYKSWFNPIIEKEGSGWEQKSVAQPSLIPEEGMFHIYYQGWDNTNVFQIGYAIIP